MSNYQGHRKINTKLKTMKKTVLYTRVSSVDQNEDRQLTEKENYDIVLTDKCSGSIPLFNRPHGKRIMDLIEREELESLTIHSIDRLGRNTLNVLNVWQQLTELGITVICKNPDLINIKDGKVNEVSKLIISILSIMAEWERKAIKERQKEGILLAQAKGLYSGRPAGTKETKEQFLNKPKTKKIIESLERNYSWAEICSIHKCGAGTINKIKQLIK